MVSILAFENIVSVVSILLVSYRPSLAASSSPGERGYMAHNSYTMCMSGLPDTYVHQKPEG